MRRSDQPAATWRNWAGNESARPRRIAVPRSTHEVADEVRKAAADGLTVRMAGTGHSFTPVAATDGVLLRPGGMTSIRSVDAAAGLVTVEAGCPLHVLNASLLARGLSLANMGDIQVQTVAGATQTGTHGTGRDVGGMAPQVAGLELVLADGTVVSVGPGGTTPPDPPPPPPPPPRAPTPRPPPHCPFTIPLRGRQSRPSRAATAPPESFPAQTCSPQPGWGWAHSG